MLYQITHKNTALQILKNEYLSGKRRRSPELLKTIQMLEVRYGVPNDLKQKEIKVLCVVKPKPELMFCKRVIKPKTPNQICPTKIVAHKEQQKLPPLLYYPQVPV